MEPDPGTVARVGLPPCGRWCLPSSSRTALSRPRDGRRRRSWRWPATYGSATASDRGHDAGGSGGPGDDHQFAASNEESEADRDRLIALVELARGGDADAFGMLFDHYHGSVYRFLFHRTRSTTLAEDLTSETFFRALRSMSNFRWQGKDFGAWLMTIAATCAPTTSRPAAPA